MSHIVSFSWKKRTPALICTANYQSWGDNLHGGIGKPHGGNSTGISIGKLPWGTLPWDISNGAVIYGRFLHGDSPVRYSLQIPPWEIRIPSHWSPHWGFPMEEFAIESSPFLMQRCDMLEHVLVSSRVHNCDLQLVDLPWRVIEAPTHVQTGFVEPIPPVRYTYPLAYTSKASMLFQPVGLAL